MARGMVSLDEAEGWRAKADTREDVLGYTEESAMKAGVVKAVRKDRELLRCSQVPGLG